jgi:drug/metabolite transporter (DMT)-like permease
MQSSGRSSRLFAVLQAILVTVLWSTSWVLIKIGLRGNLPPITFAGLRYGLAVLCLAPFIVFNPAYRFALRGISRQGWLRLALLGVVYYALTQGSLFISLAYLPAVMVNLLLNLTPVIVGGFAVLSGKERPSLLQWLGIILAALGTAVYFLPLGFKTVAVFGLAVAFFCLLANSYASFLGRQANRDLSIPPLLVTFISMSIGAILLLGTGLLVQGFGKPAMYEWGIIIWLAVVNTALAFTLWNNTLRTLTAVESSILNSLMMPQIALLAIIFLGEQISVKQIIGLVLVGGGVILVNLFKSTE